MKIRWLAVLGVLLTVEAFHAQGQAGQEQAAPSLSKEAVISDAEIHDILAERIDQKRQSVGIVVGVIEDRGERVIPYGSINQGDGRPLNGDTVFEIGALTNVFTALLLSEMAQRGEVAWTDPVSNYLPATVRLPKQGTRAITLADLATHTAGLPLLPSNLHPKNTANPWADYTEADLFNFLAGYKLSGELGTDYRYSNLDAALLSLALSRRAGIPYEALLRARILDPLGLRSTYVSTPRPAAILAVGHNQQLQPTPNWESSVMAGAIGLHSTANDLLTVLEVALGYRRSPLAPAMAAMLGTRRPTRYAGLEIAIGWHVLTTSTTQIMWHNGGTGGFRAFWGFSPRTKTGIIVLSNTGAKSGIDDIGLRLFSSTPPEMLFQREHKEFNIDPKLLPRYVGQYQLPDGTIVGISLMGGILRAQIATQTFDLTPESSRDFFVKNIEGQITFVTDREGSAYMLVMHQAGTDVPARKMP